MLNVQTLSFLASPMGYELINEARALHGDLLTRLTRLRKTHSPEIASAVVELLELRSRATAKFSHAEPMFFTPQGLEQSSGDVIANWRAARFPSGANVLDLCCGNGGDATALGARGPVYAFDMDPSTALCAKLNADALNVSDYVSVACADVTHVNLCAEAAFFDPSRRKDGRRVRDGSDYAPPLNFIHDIQTKIPNLAVKVSPAIDEETLAVYPDARLEFVSVRGECKEAILWFGEIAPRAKRQATLLPLGLTLTSDTTLPPMQVTTPKEWLYEPDAAVVRAHLIAEVAAQIGGTQVDSQIAYLTSDELCHSPFTTSYAVVEWMPFNLKRLQARLRTLGRKVVAIKRRGVPLEPNALAHKLTGAGDVPSIIVLTRVNEQPTAIICDPPTMSVQTR